MTSPAAAPAPAPSRSTLDHTQPRTRRRRMGGTFWVASGLLGTVLLTVAVVPLLPFFDPDGQDLAGRFAAPFTSADNPLGSDQLGRDLLSRLAVAGRVSLGIAIPAVALNLLIGVTLGLLAGYFGGKLDSAISALAEVQLAVPIMLLVIAIVSAIGPSTLTLIVVIGLTNWVGYARVARATAWSLRDREFIWAPLTHGASRTWVISRHLVPNVVPVLAVMVPFDIGVIVLLEAALSFLGMGIQAPTPSWGGMIKDSQQYLRDYSFLALLPGLMLFMFVAGVQFMARALTSEGAIDHTSPGKGHA